MIRPGFKFSYLHQDGLSVVLRADPELDYATLVEVFKQFSLAVGYTPGTINQYFSED